MPPDQHDYPSVECLFAAMVTAIEAIHQNEDGTCNFLHPASAFLINTEKDTLHYGEMLQAADRPNFVEAMQKEVTGLTDILEVVPRSSLPHDAKPLPAVWAFHRKRNPDWSISKWKARLNAHGGRQQHGVNYWETYAPVVNWSTVRLVIILSLLNGFHSRQVDFIQAYMQAPLECPIYIEVPAGYGVQDGKLHFVGENHKATDRQFALRLRRNIYGLKQAGRSWYMHLQDVLSTMNFRQSKVDKCLFIRADCMLLLYVDDCLIFSPSKTVLDSVIQALGAKFRITIEDEVTTYLGLEVSRNSEGTLVVRQPGLIDKVITICGLEQESNQHNTPANTILQPSMPTDDTRQFTWSYRQVIGMLNYIAASTRPDISFAMHQCARFSTNPNRIHELAVKRIVRYLKGTRDKGYILRPNGTHTIDCYVDADFAGAWTTETSSDPTSVKSRSGYVITYASCPILWSSKLQTEIALSTTEAEYISLSQAMRDLIPLRTIFQELSKICQIPSSQINTHSTVFEDNKGCVDLIAAPTMRPRSRHIAIKYHHFREHVRRGHIRIHWISTDKQLADIFTKPLVPSKFTHLRTQLLGW
jgi:hypothetical protein